MKEKEVMDEINALYHYYDSLRREYKLGSTLVNKARFRAYNHIASDLDAIIKKKKASEIRKISELKIKVRGLYFIFSNIEIEPDGHIKGDLNCYTDKRCNLNCFKWFCQVSGYSPYKWGKRFPLSAFKRYIKKRWCN